WMKNKYGAPLRALVSDQFHLAYYVDMVETPAFLSEVSAYPAITIIRREKQGPTRIVRRPPIDAHRLSRLAKAILAQEIPEESGIVEVPRIVNGSEPWILDSFDQLAVVRRLEAEFPLLEEAGCKVGIGVATGADQVYTGKYEELNVEPDRKLPLVKTKDIEGGTVQWKGHGVINPFADDGSLVDLSEYPRLARYLEKHIGAIRRRRCAREHPKGWYRTIDRIYPELTHKPKLLIPDIKGQAHIVYEDGHYYPHHNLYFITSDDWDLKALQAVLLSGIAKLFVSTYSTQMRGGYLRFQAQYLRRIRLPRWKRVPEEIQVALITATKAGDLEACNRAAFNLYRLTSKERAAIGGNGKS
ncbi:MAG: TaqI-like C-terminal specificity domain-containing protein, partial [Desulfobacterales bacterium]|nr:TaqI-like C-terminal specificity domain-containing protein [Desulfobacterales bacterium]